MRRRYWIGVCVVAGIAAAVVVATMREPRFQGKSLSAWLSDFESERPEMRYQAADSVRRMGTSAVPFLIERLRYRGPLLLPLWKLKLQELLNKQSFFKSSFGRLANMRSQSLAALDALGPAAKGALPALETLLHEKRPDPRVVLVIARLGPEAVPALTRALTNDEKVIRFGARVCLEMLQTHSETLFPKTEEDAEFMRRECVYNMKVLKKAWEEYNKMLPSGLNPIPTQSLTADFNTSVEIPADATGFTTNVSGSVPQRVKSNPFE